MHVCEEEDTCYSYVGVASLAGVDCVCMYVRRRILAIATWEWPP
jgi:hypothetical protein